MKDTLKKEICKRVKQIRLAVCGDIKGSVKVFAAKIDMNASTYRNYEEDRVCIYALKQISQATGVSIDSIVFGGKVFNQEKDLVKKLPVYSTEKERKLGEALAASKWISIEEIADAIEDLKEGRLIYAEDKDLKHMKVMISIGKHNPALINEETSSIINPEDLVKPDEQLQR